MLKLIFRRLLEAVPTLLVLITVSFFMMRLAPGSPFTGERNLPPAVLANIEAKYHLNDPLYLQYFHYLKQLAQGDFGPSFKYKDYTVNELLAQAFPVSLELGIYAFIVALLLGALPAVYALYLRRKLPDDKPTAPPSARLPWTERLAALWAPAHRRNTLMLWILWFTVVFSYYGMFLWLPSVMIGKGFALIKSFEYVLLMTLAQLPGYFTAAWLIERMGRKFVLVVYLLGTAASAWAFGNATTDGMLLLFGALLSFFNLGAWGALYAYSPENYPAPIRASGCAIC